MNKRITVKTIKGSKDNKKSVTLELKDNEHSLWIHKGALSVNVSIYDNTFIISTYNTTHNIELAKPIESKIDIREF